MKTKNRTQQGQVTQNQNIQAEEMDPLSVCEHATIPGFINRCPRKFHIPEITRFGNEVNRIAESIGISYFTTIDRNFGMIRLYPVPMLRRVYDVMAAQFGWEAFIDALPMNDGQKSIRATERMRETLRAAADNIDDPDVAEALAKVQTYLARKAERVTGPTLRTV